MVREDEQAPQGDAFRGKVKVVDVLDEAEFRSVIDAARAGEEWALMVLYRSHHQRLTRFLYGLVRDEAEDLASETWIDAAGALGTFVGGAHEFRGLLYTIARRRAVDHIRKSRRRRTISARSGSVIDVRESPDTADVMIALDSSERAVRLIADLLPAHQAEVVLLRIVVGLRVPEVAAVLGIKPAAVSVLQTRALQRLASRLGSPASWERLSESR